MSVICHGVLEPITIVIIIADLQLVCIIP